MNFFIKYKKIFILASFIVVVILLGYLIFTFFFTPDVSEPTPSETSTTTTPGGLPIAGEGAGRVVEPGPIVRLIGEGVIDGIISDVANGGLTQTNELNDVPSMAPTLSSDGADLQYYNQDDGKFYRIDKDGNLETLSDKVFHSVDEIVWSPNKDKAILEYPDGANIIYDFDTERQITLPSHWKEFDFSPNGEQIVMKSIGLDPENRWIATVNEDGSKVSAIELMGDNDETVYPSWSPNNQTVAMYTKGIDFNRQEVFFIGQNEENFKSTTVEGRGFQPKWEPSGDKLLYSVYSSETDLKPNLWIVGASGDDIGSGRKNLSVETWADKCTFTNDSELYCAIPESLEKGAGLFPELAQSTTDNLYKIDTRTGAKKLIAVPDGSYNMSNLIVSDNGYQLYFTDNSTGRLNKIKLK